MAGAMRKRLAGIDTGDRTSNRLDRAESRARATAATLAAVSLPAHQAQWKAKLLGLETDLNLVEDIEAEILAKSPPGVVPASLTKRIGQLRERMELFSIASKDGVYGLSVVEQLEEEERYGKGPLDKYKALEKSLKKHTEKSMSLKKRQESSLHGAPTGGRTSDGYWGD